MPLFLGKNVRTGGWEESLHFVANHVKIFMFEISLRGNIGFRIEREKKQWKEKMFGKHILKNS